jgi:cation diffusion facilitator family transporter
MLYGLSRARKNPDAKHPFGYGMELYFWAFVVAILIFALGYGISLYEGIKHFRNPEVISDPTWNYVVLSLSMLFEGWAWTVAFREFRLTSGKNSLWSSIIKSKDPTIFTILLEDTAAMLGLMVAFIGILLAQVLEMPELDGLASIVIAGILGGIACILAFECKGLLIGESARPAVNQGIEKIVSDDPRILSVNEMLTMHLGPNDVLVNISLDFADDLSAQDVENVISEFETRIKSEFSDVSRVFIEAQSLASHNNSSSIQKSIQEENQ